MQAIFWPILVWIFREVVLKFVIMAIVFVIVGQLTPMAAGYLTSFISTSSMTSLWSAIPSGVWFFLDWFRLDVGVPLLITAYVARFLIRRIPFIG